MSFSVFFNSLSWNLSKLISLCVYNFAPNQIYREGQHWKDYAQHIVNRCQTFQDKKNRWLTFNHRLSISNTYQEENRRYYLNIDYDGQFTSPARKINKFYICHQSGGGCWCKHFRITDVHRDAVMTGNSRPWRDSHRSQLNGWLILNSRHSD